MARLEMVVEYEKGKMPRAERLLKAASHGLELLRALERELTKQRMAQLPWQIDIVSSYRCCLIVYRCEKAEAEAVVAAQKAKHA